MDRPIVNPYRNSEGASSEIKSPCHGPSARVVIIITLVLLSTLSYVFHITHPSTSHESPKLRGEGIRRGKHILPAQTEEESLLTPEEVKDVFESHKERIAAAPDNDHTHKLKAFQNELDEHKVSTDLHKLNEAPSPEGPPKMVEYTPPKLPSQVVTLSPTVMPTLKPTVVPTWAPTAAPTVQPTVVPTAVPTYSPTYTPTAASSENKVTVTASSSTGDKASSAQSVDSSSTKATSAFVIDMEKTKTDALLNKLVDQALEPVHIPEQPVELPHPEGGDIVQNAQPNNKLEPPSPLVDKPVEPVHVPEPVELPHPEGGDIVHNPEAKVEPMTPPVDPNAVSLPDLQVPEEGPIKVEKLSLPVAAKENPSGAGAAVGDGGDHAAQEQKEKESADALNALLNTPEHPVAPVKSSTVTEKQSTLAKKTDSPPPPPAAAFKIPAAIAKSAAESVVTTNGSSTTVKRKHSVYDLKEIVLVKPTTIVPAAAVLPDGVTAAPIDYCKGTTDPFKDQPVETFQPPPSSPFEKVNEWEDIVADTIKGISKMKVGGDILREKIRSEIRRLQGVRFKMFCMYIQ